MNDNQWRAAWQLCQSFSSMPETERQAMLVSNSSPEFAAAVLAVVNETECTDAIDSKSLGPSAVIGRYVLGEIVGYGGMALVFAAEDLELGRRVALKFLSRRAALPMSSTELFIHEAKAASALNHPNIVTVYEIVRSDWGLAIAMELVDGVSWRQLCGKSLPLQDVAYYGRQIAQALSAAHARGIVHRDIKPENIMARRDGYVKVLDFGLARLAPASTANGDPQASHSLPAGTWRYMSPEQVRGEQITPASDIFSLGLVLYEMCAGEHAFPVEWSRRLQQRKQSQSKLPSRRRERIHRFRRLWIA